MSIDRAKVCTVRHTIIESNYPFGLKPVLKFASLNTSHFSSTRSSDYRVEHLRRNNDPETLNMVVLL